MTFGADHYVPVLKVKDGEKRALRNVGSRLRSRMTPLLEIVERKSDKDMEHHLSTAFERSPLDLKGYPRCFLDVRELKNDGSKAADMAFRRARDAELTFTPVTGLSDRVDVHAALRHRTDSIALRLAEQDVKNENFSGILHEFLSRHGLSPEKIDLIADLGPIDDKIPPGIAGLAAKFFDAIPEHSSWRTFTLSGCAFPKSMKGVNRNSHVFVDRMEWSVWKDLYERRRSLERLPTFSDCAIQHTLGVEGFDPRTMQVSATIRYALDDSWLLVKGESVRKKPAKEQFPALARKLTKDSELRPHFMGRNHCQGCESIEEAAGGASGFGSAAVWRRIGTIHHLSTVVRSLESLQWP